VAGLATDRYFWRQTDRQTWRPLPYDSGLCGAWTQHTKDHTRLH